MATALRRAETTTAAAPAYDVERVRRDFPILSTRVHGRPLVYLDTAASAQKPQVVIDALKGFYENDYANIHRGVYELSVRATDAYDLAREKLLVGHLDLDRGLYDVGPDHQQEDQPADAQDDPLDVALKEVDYFLHGAPL